MTTQKRKRKSISKVRAESQAAISQAATEEDRFTTAEGRELIMTEKFKDWCALYFDKSKPETYGNATRCALAVYNTDSYYNAGAIGHTNYKKLQNIARTIAENEGFGIADLMKIGLSKMTQGSFSDWKTFMEILGYIEPPSKTPPQSTFNFDNLNVAIMQERRRRGLLD